MARYEEAIDTLRPRALRSPESRSSDVRIAIVDAETGRDEEARAAAREACYDAAQTMAGMRNAGEPCW